MLFVVDASGSMARPARGWRAVKGAVLSLLLDAYQRRDKVGLVTFRGARGRAGAAAHLVGARRPRPGWRACRPAAAPRWPRACCGARDRCASSGCATRGAGRCSSSSPTAGPPAARRRRLGRLRAAALLAATGVAARRRRLRVRAGAARPGRRLGRRARRATACRLDELGRRRARRRRARLGTERRAGLMPQGQPSAVPDDGLTTRQRRNRPLLIVHTGDDEGQVDRRVRAWRCAAWNQGWPIGGLPVRQDRRSGRSARRPRCRAGPAARADRRGRPGRLAQDGRGLVVDPARPAPRRDHAADAAEGWAQIKRDLAAETLPASTCSTSSPTR